MGREEREEETGGGKGERDRDTGREGKRGKKLRVRALRRSEKGRQRQGEGREVREWEGETYPLSIPS